MTNPPNHIEVVTSVRRRRRWTAFEKLRMVEETFDLRAGMTVSLVARQHGVAPNQLSAALGQHACVQPLRSAFGSSYPESATSNLERKQGVAHLQRVTCFLKIRLRSSRESPSDL